MSPEQAAGPAQPVADLHRGEPESEREARIGIVVARSVFPHGKVTALAEPLGPDTRPGNAHVIGGKARHERLGGRLNDGARSRNPVSPQNPRYVRYTVSGLPAVSE